MTESSGRKAKSFFDPYLIRPDKLCSFLLIALLISSFFVDHELVGDVQLYNTYFVVQNSLIFSILLVVITVSGAMYYYFVAKYKGYIGRLIMKQMHVSVWLISLALIVIKCAVNNNLLFLLILLIYTGIISLSITIILMLNSILGRMQKKSLE